MNIEIERKFLVKNNDYKKFAHHCYTVKQGYLSSVAERVVRIRVRDEEAFLTIKSNMAAGQFSRFEWEKSIPLADAEMMLQFCENSVVEKKRFLVRVGEHIFEVDEFLGDNEGLVVAEIELQSESEPFVEPDWLGIEVTDDGRFYNSYLSKHPFCSWQKG